jgi:hypothetical protein
MQTSEWGIAQPYHYKWICGHKKLIKDSANAVCHQIMLWHNHKSDKQGIHYMVLMTPIHASSLLARQGPWITFGNAITCHTSHKQIWLNRAPTHKKDQYTLFSRNHSITCEYVQLDWLHHTFHKRHNSLFAHEQLNKEKPLHVHHSCTWQQTLYTQYMVNNSTVVSQSIVTPTWNECT